MAYRQPRIPEYNEAEGAGKALRALILFLKDFTMSAWTANNRRKREIEAIWAGMPEMPEIAYPVTSVNGKGGDVQLEAADVGALGKTEQAADSACFDGRTWAQAMLALHPVGSIYMSLESTSPAQLFGGTWERLMDRFLLGAGGSYAAEAVGGEEKHTLTISEMPSHEHDIFSDWTTTNAANNTWSYKMVSGVADEGGTWAIEPNGGSQAHNNMPPYIAVNMWRRIAEEAADGNLQ